MSRITTKEELLESLKNVLHVEISAKVSYLDDMEIFIDKKIVSTISDIEKDEEHHIKILNSLIKMLEKE